MKAQRLTFPKPKPGKRSVLPRNLSLMTGFTLAVCALRAELPSNQRTFSAPKEAVEALKTAALSGDKSALEELFGPDLKTCVDLQQIDEERTLKSFATSAEKHCECVPKGQRTVALEIGPDHWTFPIPLKKESSRWYFDVAAGREEILNRQIGSDELHAIGLCRAYAARSKDSKATESAKLDGLLALARSDQPSSIGGNEACHGYRFRILPSSGERPSGGLLAYPAEWGRSGVMTFYAAGDGKIYQRDLGAETDRIARDLTQLKPGGQWKAVRDEGVQDWGAPGK